MVGSCTNGSWHDMRSVAERGARQAACIPSISFVVFPGSHRILETMAREGLLADLLAAGATVSEPTCGSCAGIGHVPAAGTKSLRAFNRNFPGRSGVKDDEIYLCSSVTAAASALTGVITDPAHAGRRRPRVTLPARFAASEAGSRAAPDGAGRGRARARTSSRCRSGEPVAESLEAPVLLKLGDKVSTDDISPAGTAVAACSAPTCPAIAEFCFRYVDPEFVARAKAAGGGIIVGGEIYGQGSSREAAVIAPHVPRRARGDRQVLRAHPPREPDQLGPRAARRSTTPPTTTASSATIGSASTACAPRWPPAQRVDDREHAHGRAASRPRACSPPRERDILLAGGLLAHTPDRRSG